MKKQIKWWMIPLGFLAVVLLNAFLLWPTLKIYLAPKTVLTAALTDTYANLEQRLKNSPLVLIGHTLDLENGNTLEMELDTSNDLLGPVGYDMTMQVQWNPRRILARGHASAQSKNVDLSLYLDGDFAALSSAGILQGNYYGLTYDTFEEDIRSNKLLSFVIGDNTVRQWVAQIESLETFMEDSWELSSISKEDIRSIMVGILTLKADVDREDMELNGTKQTCHVISFKATGAQIATGMDYLSMKLPISLDSDDEVDIGFWLLEDTVVKIEASSDDMNAELYLGSNEAITLRYENAGEVTTAIVSTWQDAENYQETIQIIGAESIEVSYNWNLTTGDLILSMNREGEEGRAAANLRPTESGFRVATADTEALMHLLLGTKDSGNSACIMTVFEGSEFETPAYKNFSNWSLEDLATLLGGVGSLFGLNIG